MPTELYNFVGIFYIIHNSIDCVDEGNLRISVFQIIYIILRSKCIVLL